MPAEKYRASPEITRSRPLSVGELAERTGVAVSALHFYEARGLIASERSEGNQRRYARAMLRRVAVIKVAQRMGLPLAAIAEALARLPRGRTPTVADWRKMSAGWRGELDERIRTLTQLRDQLDGCIGCGCLSLKQCPLRNPQDMMAAHGPGAHFPPDAQSVAPPAPRTVRRRQAARG